MGRRYTDRLPQDEQWNEAQFSAGPFKLDDREKKFYVEGKEKHLSPKLFGLLTLFMVNANRVLSTAELASNLQDANYCPDKNEVKQYIYLLRRVIESDPAKPRWLFNVRGFGYQLKIN